MSWLGSSLAKIGDYIRSKSLVLMSNEQRVRVLRRRGVRIGENCIVAASTSFSTEPYLIEIGDRVAISAGCEFIVHDASVWLFRREHPDLDVFGSIRVGNNVFFGTNCTLLPNCTIGSDCIIGSGSVVRGEIPDGSVVFGNPAKVVMKTALMKQLLLNHKHRLKTHNLSPAEKERVIREHFGVGRPA